jgi:hypothetical protein
VSRKQQAREWAQGVARRHLPATARRYSLAIYVAEASISSTLGIRFDLQPAEGKVVELTDEWILLKCGRAADLFVVARDLVDVVPAPGDVVRITPYARRGFDGRRLDAPTETVTDSGLRMQSWTLGESRSRLPIDKESLKSMYLRDMIDQVETLDAGDGIRCMSQVLVDAGAWRHPVEFVDPDDCDIIATPPALKFRVATAKHDGGFEIRYDRAADTYGLFLTGQDGAIVKQCEGALFDDIAGIAVDWLDDGSWRIAKVEILKPAPRTKAA